MEWTINNKRMQDGNFQGADIIQRQAKHGTERKLVGLILEGRAIARPGSIILDRKDNIIGENTSGTFSPTLGRPIALGYVPSIWSKKGTSLKLKIRKSIVAASVETLPFVPHKYFKPEN